MSTLCANAAVVFLVASAYSVLVLLLSYLCCGYYHARAWRNAFVIASDIQRKCRILFSHEKKLASGSVRVSNILYFYLRNCGDKFGDDWVEMALVKRVNALVREIELQRTALIKREIRRELRRTGKILLSLKELVEKAIALVEQPSPSQKSIDATVEEIHREVGRCYQLLWDAPEVIAAIAPDVWQQATIHNREAHNAQRQVSS
ncbi:hypothetical protein HYV72_01610 [Candidatus Uhrbacteria bacterium]|nr:hypothetical protein [Candidatus Uhrbacteria bacterium]